MNIDQEENGQVKVNNPYIKKKYSSPLIYHRSGRMELFINKIPQFESNPIKNSIIVKSFKILIVENELLHTK